MCFPLYYNVWNYNLFNNEKLYQFNKIKETLKEINYGDTTKIIDLDEYSGELKEIAAYINEISSGLENAVNEKIKIRKTKNRAHNKMYHTI